MAKAEVLYTKTPVGELLYAIAFTDRTDKSIARKFEIPIAEIRNLRKSPIITKLRGQVKRDRRRKP